MSSGLWLMLPGPSSSPTSRRSDGVLSHAPRRCCTEGEPVARATVSSSTASPRFNRRLHADLFLFALTLISSARKVYLEQLSVAADGSFTYKLHNTQIGITIMEPCFGLTSWRRFLLLSFFLTFVSWNCERDQCVADGIP